jgi:hypothetical protein
MEGLRPRRQTAEDDTARNGVPTPVLPPCPPPRIRSNPPLRIPGEPLSWGLTSPLPRVAGDGAGVGACNHCGQFIGLALSEVWRGDGCHSEIQRSGTLQMQLFRLLVTARSGPVKHAVPTTPARRCARTSHAARPAVHTAGSDSFLISCSGDSEHDPCSICRARPIHHRFCRYQIGIQIP